MVNSIDKTAYDYLEESGYKLSERGMNYDTSGQERSMEHVVKAFNALFNQNITETMGWEFMSLLKKRRKFSSSEHHEDSCLDDVGYAALAAESSRRNNK